MKNKLIIAAVLLISVLSIGTSSVIFDNNYYIPEEKNQDKHEIIINDLVISIDARMELLFIVQYLSDYFLINNLNIKYKDDISEWFDKYRDHEIITHYKSMLSNGFGYDAPPTSMLYLDHSFTPDRKFTDDLVKRAGGIDKLEKFIELLKDFAEVSSFNKFFKQQSDFYNVILKDMKYNLKGFNEITTIENYFGQSNKKYTVILTPLGQGNYGPRISTDDGNEIYSINGTRGQNGDIPTFGDKKGFEYLVWHEFAHSFVNPLTEKYSSEIEKVEYLFEPIKEEMTNIAYGNWATCVNEHIIRAYTSRLQTIKHGEEAGIMALRSELGKKFIYVGQIMEKLLEYENNRDKFKSFENFYPYLIKAFSSFTDKDADLIPTINNAISKDAVIIISSNEPDDGVQKEIIDFVQSTKDRFFKNSKIISDTQALKSDLKDNNIVVFGSLNGNLWLKKHMDIIPVKFGPGSITAAKVYKGNQLRFITAWRNPYNNAKSMVIYTAINAKDIIFINRIFHGPTNYVIADGNEILNSSFYSKDGSKWICN